MLKFFYLLLLFLVPFLSAQSTGEKKLIYPAFIPQNTTFDISLVATNSYFDSDTLELYVIPGEKIVLNKVEIRSVYENSKLSFTSSVLEGEGPAYKIPVDLTDSLRVPGTFFQFLFTFKVQNAGSARINFFGVLKKNHETAGYLFTDSENERKSLSADLNFYRPQKTAGNALLLAGNSNFDISLKESEISNLLCSFWIYPNNRDITILKISNNKMPSEIIELQTNFFQMLSVRSNHDFSYINPVFISKKVWYYISLLFSSQKSEINFYCDGELFASVKTAGFTEPGDLVFHFENKNEEKSYAVDLLRFINLKHYTDSPGITDDFMIDSRHTLDFDSDSSDLIKQFTFENTDEITSENEEVSVEFMGAKLIKSDAPVFAKAPELNITLFGNTYRLEWNGGDFRQASNYILEKSKDNSGFSSLYNIHADNSEEKTYSFIDKQDNSAGIVFYRIKQINKDGSFVYSSQVKVGQGDVEQFTIGQNFPNPFNPKTSIEIEMIQASDVEIIIYSLEGREVSKFFKGFLSEGVHRFDFDGSNLPSGIYLFKVMTPSYTQTKKMVLAK